MRSDWKEGNIVSTKFRCGFVLTGRATVGFAPCDGLRDGRQAGCGIGVYSWWRRCWSRRCRDAQSVFGICIATVSVCVCVTALTWAGFVLLFVVLLFCFPFPSPFPPVLPCAPRHTS